MHYKDFGGSFVNSLVVSANKNIVRLLIMLWLPFWSSCAGWDNSKPDYQPVKVKKENHFVRRVEKIDYKILNKGYTLKDRGLHGNVASFTLCRYMMKPGNGDLVKKMLEKYTEIFNDSGWLAESYKYGIDSELREKWAYHYDDSGLLNERNCFDPNGKLNRKYNTLYNMAGQEVETSCYDAAGTAISKVLVLYNTAGNIIGMKLKMKDMPDNYESFTYKNNGFIMENILYKTNGIPDKKFINKYNENGKLYITYTSKGLSSVIDQIDSIQYDDKGNPTEYDDLNADGTIYKKTVCKYDNKNNVTEETHYLPDGKIDYKNSFKMLNEYDSNNNLVKQLKTIGTPQKPEYLEITEIEITYH